MSTVGLHAHRHTLEELEAMVETARSCVPGVDAAIAAAIDRKDNPVCHIHTTCSHSKGLAASVSCHDMHMHMQQTHAATSICSAKGARTCVLIPTAFGAIGSCQSYWASSIFWHLISVPLLDKLHLVNVKPKCTWALNTLHLAQNICSCPGTTMTEAQEQQLQAQKTLLRNELINLCCTTG